MDAPIGPRGLIWLLEARQLLNAKSHNMESQYSISSKCNICVKRIALTSLTEYWRSFELQKKICSLQEYYSCQLFEVGVLSIFVSFIL